LEIPINAPADLDGDGIDDLTEFEDLPSSSPFNAAVSVPMEHGMVALQSEEDFNAMGTSENNTPWVTYLEDVEFTKFIIEDFFSDQPKLHFINTNTHPLHSGFSGYLGFDQNVPTVRKGQIMYNPSVLANNGTLGAYTFNFSSNGLVEPFEVVQRTFELIAANMPFLENNLSYLFTTNDEEYYEEAEALFQNSRIPFLFEEDAFAGINYWGLNQAESYGFFRLVEQGETPNPRDIVLYESIPNVMPHVGGIITSEVQTPLSHVNLRAIQDNIPNAFIRNPLEIEEIADLLGQYVYFRADQSSYELREATLEEVNDWYESIRPTEEQHPPLDLSYTSILSLDDIDFSWSDAYGAKTTNVATMRTFGFTEGTIPNGFGIPFYYYQQFMEYNGFFAEVNAFLEDSVFLGDRNVRELRLEQFREQIEEAPMPVWMMSDLSQLYNSFPEGTRLRCRSSTNNEDLPEFSGAGLYDSKTHHPDEGHLSKTIKEVFASLWNLRAFDERDFFRINHFESSMGVLCHPNFEAEMVNGVGVSIDPIYATENTFYFNSQLGEELITNPGSAKAEELLIDRYAQNIDGYSIIQYSSLVPEDTLLMTYPQLDLLRQYLAEIHERFAVLYDAQDNSTFAMDIEFKITSENQLAIKQARPWVSYEPFPIPPIPLSECGTALYPNPSNNFITLVPDLITLTEMGTIRIFALTGKLVYEENFDFATTNSIRIDVSDFPQGMYVVHGLSANSNCAQVKFIKN
jgi:hypothetical protein